ncbi:MAG: glycoside hydrolase family 9 protein [Chloroflexota bacterium]
MEKKLRSSKIVIPILLAAGMLLLLLLLAPTQAARADFLFHSTFESDMDGWDIGNWGGDSTPSVETGQLCVTVTNPGSDAWNVSVYRRPVAVQENHTYTVTYDIRASAPITVQVLLQHNGSPYNHYYTNQGFAISETLQTVTASFTADRDDTNAEMTFQIGGPWVPAGTMVCIDNVSLEDPAFSIEPTPTPSVLNINQEGYFPNGAKYATYRTDQRTPLDWTLKDQHGTVAFSGQTDVFTQTLVISGTSVLTSTDQASGDTVHIIDFSEYDITGTGYTLEVAKPGDILVESDFESGSLDPWNAWFTTPASGTYGIVDGRTCLTVTAGGTNRWDIGMSFASFSLEQDVIYDVSFEAQATGETRLRSKIGEVGGSWAEFWSTSEPLTLTGTAQVISGTFSLAGEPPAQVTFDINIGGDLATGTPPFTVCIDNISLRERNQYDRSNPFGVDPDLYDSLQTDALRYFYHVRSGIAITMPFAGDMQWTRAAGPADDAVGCRPGDSACPYTYTLNVSKGWYDAGDYGKYVVNGGIAAWTLMNEYERNLYYGVETALGDGMLNIPESGNEIPDILDEARWEMEFLLAMQVPDGYPLAGMAHHKMHDEGWGPLPQAPAENTANRYLHAPSTAATLNLAATAAQCARIWQGYDTTFAAQCLAAAEKAWEAAVANPDRYADPSDGNGGGTYADGDVSDEFYWAAAELYVTTGEETYLEYMQESAIYLQLPTGEAFKGWQNSMGWPETAALGTISLALVPNDLAPTDVITARNNIVAAGDVYLNIALNEGYGVPTTPGQPGGYVWGSNATMLNNAIIMALAHDFSQDAKYIDGVIQAMDYLLGRNPLGKSYISGYGENPLLHPHHRFWANEGIYPPPPPGVVAGGPNSNLQDGVAASQLAGCIYQNCYLDNRDSYSTNEVAINWNAPLAWVTAFLDEQMNRLEPVRFYIYAPIIIR